MLTILKKLFGKKGEEKKESPMAKIIDWGSTGCCFMNSCFWIIILLGILITIGVIGEVVEKVLEKVISPVNQSNITKTAETVANNPTMQKLLE